MWFSHLQKETPLVSHMTTTAYVKKAFSVSRESSVKSDKCPQVMSLESASAGAKDKFENDSDVELETSQPET